MNGVVRLPAAGLGAVALLAAAAFALSPSPPDSRARGGTPEVATAPPAPNAHPAAVGGGPPGARAEAELRGARPLTPSLELEGDGAGASRRTVHARAAPVRFQTIDVYVDAGGKPLAAYQVSVRSAAKNALLSGLEGGDHPAFARPPYYDPKALIDETVIVAGLSTADDLPRGRTRVARLHVQVTGADDPRFEAKLHVAAGPDGAAVAATVTVESQSGGV